jgi:GTPase
VKSRKFIDSVVLYAFAGKGGDGCASFRRETHIPRGGPSGGDGGNGGNVILKADNDQDSLIHIYFSPHQRAEPGGNGRGKDQYGRTGKDCIIRVPRGTEVKDINTGELIADIVADGEELIIAHGGKGGLGNIHFKTATHRGPTEQTDGEPGEEVSLRLDLKLMADVGLVGFPNAGKSSLLMKLSDAHPKVAPYPFTTLNPIIGTMIFEDYSRLRVADLPGLLKDAHKGVGLGHAFLRHVERARFMVYVIDMAGVDGRLPHEDYKALKNELKLYRKDLALRPSLVVANKMDLPEAADALKEFKKKTKVKPLPISAQTGEGIDKLRDAVQELAKKNAE